ncbi:MAG TPA: D-lyxose/D-mannose family sugar isomerase [Candidatus Methylacidiphilales bacterium]
MTTLAPLAPAPASPFVGEVLLSRSLINRSVATAKKVVRELGIALPPYAYWGVEEWNRAGIETQEVRECMLGWDVTDFGSRRFPEIGRILFTLRNGRSGDPRYPKTYAEKLLIELEGQRSPMHYHRSKREDIINRGGGNMVVTLFPVGADGLPGGGRLDVRVDGVRRAVAAGERIILEPGESVTIVPGTYHQFWAQEGSGIPIDGGLYTVSSEVSSVCDDWNDNVFIDPDAVRFPSIVEDVPREGYLCHEYPKLTAE